VPSILLHIGGASGATVAVTVIVIFFLIFSLSFAFGSVPEGGRRLSGEWIAAWFRASLPRLIVAGAFSAALFFASSLPGGGGSQADEAICGRSVAPLSSQPVTDARIVSAILGLNAVAEAAAGEDADAVRVAFAGETHNLTHDIDASVRPRDPGLAAQICRRVLTIEQEVAAQAPDMTRVQEAAGGLADLLRQAQTPASTGAPSATAMPLLVSPCNFPLPRLTENPITEERLDDAIEGMRAAAAAAEAGDEETVRAILIGDAHTLTHDIDPPLRAADEQLAIDLCKAVTDVEVQASREFDAEVIRTQANADAGLLERAKVALGAGE